MKIRLIYIIYITLTYCIQIIYGQIAGQDEYNRLNKLLNYVKTMDIKDADNAKTIFQNDMDICPALDSLVNAYYEQRSKITQNISDKVNERSRLDLSKQTIKVNGIVESKERGYSIINSNGYYYAVKIDLIIGQSYIGGLRLDRGIIKYKPLGGKSYNVKIYTPVPGESPKEKYEKLTKEIERINKQQIELWNNFKLDFEQELKTEIDKRKNILIKEHYTNGEKYLEMKDYKSAYKEFNEVIILDSNYKEVKNKLDLSNNKNYIVNQSSVYQIVEVDYDHIFISTSNGLYESNDGAKTWKLTGFQGKRITKLDAIKGKIMLYISSDGLYSGVRKHNGDTIWKKITVKYNVPYAQVKRSDGTTYYSKKYEVIQPAFKVKTLKFIPYGKINIIFIQYKGRSKVKEKGKRKIVVEKSLILGIYYIRLGEELIFIPENFLSPDDGKNWAGYWGTLFGYDYHSNLSSDKGVDDLIDFVSEYSEEPDDAFDVVREWIEEKYKINDDKIKIIDYKIARSKEREDNDPVIVLTNYGIYETCWDCDYINKINLPEVDQKPLSIFFEKRNTKVIIVGYINGGLKISRDKGQTWEDIYATKYSNKKENPDVGKKRNPNEIKINYLKSGNKWKYEVENDFSGSPKQVFIMNQEILGESLIDDKLYNELNISFEGISAEGQKYYYRADEEAIFAVLDQDKGNEYIDIKLPLSPNLEWETKNKFQDVIQKVQGRQNYIFNGVEYKDCYKISFEGEYYGRKVNGYQIYNYDIGYLYVEINYSEGKQIIRLKEFFSN